MDKKQSTEENRRISVRWPFDKAIAVEADPRSLPAGSQRTRFVVACTNLSETGAGFIHRHYVHPGSRMVLYLPRVDGDLRRTTCVVVRCSYAGDFRHHCGVKFDAPIALPDFIEEKKEAA